ncbi:unnamed protein product [Lathyrus sativus]|nr:unnamed protein product [Lathyrus sativus]
MEVMTTDFAKVVAKLSYASKYDLVVEVKKLELIDEDEIDLVIKFFHKQQYNFFFWEFEGSQRMSYVRKIMRM